jgi:Tfp pilus assembly protein PilZ
MEFPIKYFENNIVVNNKNEYWALYKLEKFDYEYCNTDKKFEILESLTRFIANIGEEAKILLVPILVNYADYFKRLRDNLDEKSSLYDASIEYIENTETAVRNNYVNNVNDYDVFVIVKLTKDFSLEDWKEALGKIIIEPVKTVNQWFGIDREISRSKIDKYTKQANSYMHQQGRRIRIIPAKEDDIKWLIKKSFFRGLPEEIETWDRWKLHCQTVKEKMEELLKVDRNDMVLKLTSGEIDLGTKWTLKVNHQKETSYQSFIVITSIPDEMFFPGNEFIMFAQQMNFPVEILITINNVNTTNAIKKLDAKKRSIDSQLEHIEKNR